MGKSIILFATPLLFLLSSCRIEIGDNWDDEKKDKDRIMLSTSSALLKSSADSVSITTGGLNWWIRHVNVGDTTYYMGLDNKSYPNTSMTKEFFTIKDRTNTLFVKFNENKTGKKRFIDIVLQDGNYFDYVSIQQEP